MRLSIALQHRESWQDVGAIRESSAAVITFCMEVKKKLGIKYMAPVTPVHVTMKDPTEINTLISQGDPGSSSDVGRQSAMARSRSDESEVASSS